MVLVDELWSSVLEDTEVAELVRLMQIHLSEALDMSISKVRQHWFNNVSDGEDPLDLRLVYEMAVEEPMEEVTTGTWGNMIDPLDTTWVHPSGRAYWHDEPSLCSSPSPENYSVNSGAYYDADGLLCDWEGFQIDKDGNQFTNYLDG
jgi:hypothetical protein